ncbi:hypothetical protein C7446_0202 [Kushneria sinocarnis]|uniref:Uncharacterized protein n=1 Tax=Kushneria sinocarnis TaxID=595502 RepID=A0A420X0W7_9GAMM|nr:hypothetical protein [Kushneria sinocarnis]RKR07390.1 hypothetical protein C7446_0202 [Kushneria sinocarnis]
MLKLGFVRTLVTRTAGACLLLVMAALVGHALLAMSHMQATPDERPGEAKEQPSGAPPAAAGSAFRLVTESAAAGA